MDRQEQHTPIRDLPIHRHSPLLALYAAQWPHRLLPDSVAMWIASLMGRLLWLWPPSRRRAIGRMSLVLARTPLEDDVRKIARRQMSHLAIVTELNQRPWMLERAPIEGKERLAEVLEPGRPAIVMIAHTGCPTDVQATRVGRTIHVLAHRYLDPDAPGLRTGWWAYKARARHRRMTRPSMRLVMPGNAYVKLRDLLAQGEVVMMAPDVPGSSRTTLAGKTAYLGSGIANLAFETGAPVIPLVGRIEKRRPTFRVLEPIDPHDFAGPGALLDTLADIVTREILEVPEQHDLNTFWRELWADDSAGYSLDLWFRRPRNRRLRRRLRGKLAHVRTRFATRA